MSNEILNKLNELVETVKAAFGVADTTPSTPATPAAPRTDTFNVLVGVEVLSSAYARQSDVEAAVKQALEQAASTNPHAVSISVAGA